MPAKAVREGQGSLRAQQILLGVGLTATAVAAAALAARLALAAVPAPEVHTDYEDPYPVKPESKVLGVVWPPLMLALTVSGLQLWKAPRPRVGWAGFAATLGDMRRRMVTSPTVH